MGDKKYVIINANEVSSVDFSQVMETSVNTLRYNTGNTQTFVKFEGDTPSFLDGKTQHTHSEILTILNDGNWVTEDDTGDTTDDSDRTE
jgi:hypothetical protein